MARWRSSLWWWPWLWWWKNCHLFYQDLTINSQTDDDGDWFFCQDLQTLWSRRQIRNKYTNVEIHKYSNTQIYKYKWVWPWPFLERHLQTFWSRQRGPHCMQGIFITPNYLNTAVIGECWIGLYDDDFTDDDEDLIFCLNPLYFQFHREVPADPGSGEIKCWEVKSSGKSFVGWHRRHSQISQCLNLVKKCHKKTFSDLSRFECQHQIYCGLLLSDQSTFEWHQKTSLFPSDKSKCLSQIKRCFNCIGCLWCNTRSL